MFFLEFIPIGMAITNDGCGTHSTLLSSVVNIEIKSHIKSKWEWKSAKEFNEFI